MLTIIANGQRAPLEWLTDDIFRTTHHSFRQNSLLFERSGGAVARVAGTPASDQITPITKPVVIPAASNATTPSVTTIPISLTGQELRRLFGRDLEVVFSGSTGAGSTAVTPTQKIRISSRVQVNFNIKEQP